MAPDSPKELVKVYLIQNIPFSFDPLPELAKSNPEAIVEADSNEILNPEQMFKWSDYLIAEEVHPLIFELKIKNPEEMPVE